MTPFDSAIANAAVEGAVWVVAALAWVVVLARVVGLRSFAKMSAFDFVATVATGSLLASAATSSDPAGFARAIAAMTALFAAQWAIAWARQRWEPVRHLIDNRPRVLLKNGEFDDRALAETRVARSDIWAKLREADVDTKAEVDAVVLEATGEFSVLSGDELSDEMLDDVR